FPLLLTLRRTSDGLRVFRQPVAEIKELHDASESHLSTELNEKAFTFSSLKSDLLDLDFKIDTGSAKKIDIRVAGQPITIGVAAKSVSCLNAKAPLEIADGKISLRVLVDRTSIEIFANGGAVSLSSCFIPAKTPAESPTISTEGGAAKLLSFNG